MNITELATQCMEDPRAAGWHKVAGSAANRNLDEAKALITAVWTTHPKLTAANMLKVAANIADRAD